MFTQISQDQLPAYQQAARDFYIPFEVFPKSRDFFDSRTHRSFTIKPGFVLIYLQLPGPIPPTFIARVRHYLSNPYIPQDSP